MFTILDEEPASPSKGRDSWGQGTRSTCSIIRGTQPGPGVRLLLNLLSDFFGPELLHCCTATSIYTTAILHPVQVLHEADSWYIFRDCCPNPNKPEVPPRRSYPPLFSEVLWLPALFHLVPLLFPSPPTGRVPLLCFFRPCLNHRPHPQVTVCINLPLE